MTTELTETEMIRQSIIENKGKKNFLRDFSGDVFELTSDMMVNQRDNSEPVLNNELSGVAECILQKYARLLSLHK